MRVLIAGGGVAGLEALLALHHLAPGRLGIEVIAPTREFAYRPLAVAEELGYGRALRFDLARLVAQQDADFRSDALVAVDPVAHVAHTRSGASIRYDALVVASGARPVPPLPGAITFWGSGSEDFASVLGELRRDRHARVAFAVPTGAGWPLPVYELALLTRHALASHGFGGCRITIVTPEAEPLELFGARASGLVAELLQRRRIELVPERHPVRVTDGGLELVPSAHLESDRVVTVPRAGGRRIPGLPGDEDDLIPVDLHCRVQGLEDVYAAGDATAFPVKQGGIAAQQADAIAQVLAAEAGADVDPQPFRPVLRGLLLTGTEPAFMRAEISGGRGDTSAVAAHPLWWPPGKIAGRYLAPHLAAIAGVDPHPKPPPGAEAVVVNLDSALFSGLRWAPEVSTSAD